MFVLLYRLYFKQANFQQEYVGLRVSGECKLFPTVTWNLKTSFTIHVTFDNINAFWNIQLGLIIFPATIFFFFITVSDTFMCKP